jgi:hypothetical protein
MSRTKQAHPSFGAVVAVIAAVMVLTSGAAYAATQITGKQIKNNTVTGKDIKNENLKAQDIAPNAVTASELASGAVTSVDVLDGTLTGNDVADGSLAGVDVADGSLTGDDVADDSVSGADVADFSLTNDDVGVLFAQVSSDGTVTGSSGGVTAIVLGTGSYAVDFGRDIKDCAFVATQGEGGIGSAGGAITGVTDRSGNAEAVFTTVRNADGALANAAFQLVVVC